MFQSAIRLSLIAVGCVFMAAAQTQTPGYVVDLCVKANPGKAAELTALVHDVGAKYYRVRVDEGVQAWWIVAADVVPSGSAARCDYHVVSGYKGFPPEAATAEQVTAGLKKAGVNMTAAEYAAKRDAAGYLVNTDIWRTLMQVGSASQKGSYVRINYYKVKPGQGPEFSRLERTGWGTFVESLKGSNMGWQFNALAMPTGESLHYNASTVDVYPTWEALGKGWPTATEWPKVHPDLPAAAYTAQVNNTVERYAADVLHIIELVAPKQ
jgi:hypothetical protein